MADDNKLLDQVSQALAIAAEIAGVLLPGAGAAVSLGAKIAQGVIAAVPEAEALWAQFQSGTVPTQAELDAYALAEDGAYAKLMADIAAAQGGQP